MNTSISNKQFPVQLRILFCVVLFEFALFIFSGVSFSFLHGDGFFNLFIDPVSLLMYGLQVPQAITAHHWLGIMLDLVTLILLVLFIRNPFNNRLAIILFLLLMLFYITHAGYHTHRNYQAGFFMVFFPFMFTRNNSKHFAFEACRYFILIFYVSAAWLKLINSALMDATQFSHMLASQFTPYYLEGNTGLRTNLNLLLMQNPSMGHFLYLSSFAIEFACLIGFFTRKFDRLLAFLLLGFHFMSWLVMDIAPFGQVGFICLLLLRWKGNQQFGRKD